MFTIRGASRNAVPGRSTSTSTVERVRAGGASGPATRLTTPYAATVHRLQPSASVVPAATSPPSWDTRTRAPAIGADASVRVRTWRKFSIVRAERWSVRFTASIRNSLFRDTTPDTLVRKNALLEFARVEFRTVRELFAAYTRASLFTRRAWDTVTFTES